MKLNRLPRWKKVELAQSLFGFGILILIISTSFYFYYTAPVPISEQTIGRLRMANAAPFGTKEGVMPIMIWVEDGNGVLDRSRNDVIRINMALSRILQLNQTQVVLKNGEAQVELIPLEEGQENVMLTVVWVSGDSYLEPASMLVVYPPFGAGG